MTLQADFITQPVTKQKGSLRAEMGTLLSILYPAQALALVETSPGWEGVGGKPRPAPRSTPLRAFRKWEFLALEGRCFRGRVLFPQATR